MGLFTTMRRAWPGTAQGDAPSERHLPLVAFHMTSIRSTFGCCCFSAFGPSGVGSVFGPGGPIAGRVSLTVELNGPNRLPVVRPEPPDALVGLLLCVHRSRVQEMPRYHLLRRRCAPYSCPLGRPVILPGVQHLSSDTPGESGLAAASSPRARVEAHDIFVFRPDGSTTEFPAR